MKILIAEDDFTSRGMLAAVLKKAGRQAAGEYRCTDTTYHSVFIAYS
jgi:hypothetical protein